MTCRLDEIHEWHRDGYCVSTDRRRLDVDVIHGFLTHSYWVPGIPRDVVADSLEHSLCFGLHGSDGQVGFARVVTDFSRMAYLMDVFVLPAFRGRGLGAWLVQCVVDCPSLRDLRRISLDTADAHDLYRRFGFEVVDAAGSQMARVRDMDWYRPDQVRS
jgi:GNAT superfamily N-acetyltransferase